MAIGVVPPYEIACSMFEGEILDQFRAVLESGMLVLGQQTLMFEKRFAADHVRNFGIAVNSDTAALEAALCLLNYKFFGAESCQLKFHTLMPETAFYGCVNVVARLGGRVIPVPVTISNGIMPTKSQLLEVIGMFRGTVDFDDMVYMPVYTAGTVGGDAIACIDWCKQQGIPVVEDCAHVHGARYKDGSLAGHYGDISTFSFYATKMVHSGEGGMLLVDRQDWDEWLRIYRNYGKETKFDDPVFADSRIIGYNWRMTEFQAALGLVMWRNYPQLAEGRAKVADIYDKFFLPDTGLCAEVAKRLLVRSGQLQPNLYRYIIMVEGLERYDQNVNLYALLADKGVVLQAKCNSKPITEYWVFGDRFVIKHPLCQDPARASVKYCMGHLCLPIYPTLSRSSAYHIADTVAEVLKEGKWR